MAGLWEQVGGVFWSMPPAAVPVEEARPLSTIIMCGVVAAFVLTAVLRYVSHKLRPQGWGLRKHLGAVGAALTLAYVAIVLPIIWGRVDTLLTMPLNEVGDFLAGAFGPLAILWLVLGFLQQGEELGQNTKALEFQGDELKLSTKALLMQAKELKNSVEQQTIMAEAAKQQREEYLASLEADRKRRELEIKVLFSLRTGNSGYPDSSGMVANEIRITNDGYRAHNVVLDMQLPFDDSEPFHIGGFRAHSAQSVVVHIPNDSIPRSGTAVLRYEDADGNQKVERFGYMITNQNRIEFD
ncbi:CbtA family protein [Pseudomonas sp. B10(2017)]|uniref:CbtA family protein n=1 Tax=Pseudomonas sp. B10(2017) TaxID=1981749 RepID=UPI001179F772|nr:CbtA family protein [Pseudomonas sp. B10(2017)]